MSCAPNRRIPDLSTPGVRNNTPKPDLFKTEAQPPKGRARLSTSATIQYEPKLIGNQKPR